MGGRLAGKRALVTGATSGIGRAIARAMAAEGARVAVHGRSAARAEPVVREIRAKDGDAFAVGAELTDYAALEAMCAEALERLGGIDIAVNNAGIFAEGRILDVDLEDWERNFAVHVTAPMLVTRHVVPAMIAQGEGGSLLYLGSTSSTEPDAEWVAYTASKHALIGLMRAAASDYGRHGIRSNAIAPSWVDTRMARRYFEEAASRTGQDYASLYGEGMGTGVLNTTIAPEAVADMAVYLASDAGRHISGQTLSLCGGTVMR